MPRKPKNPTLFIAISPEMAATAIGKPVAFVHAEVLAGRIPVYQNGLARRIIVSDLESYIRDHWQRAKPRRSRKEKEAPHVET
jgi:hypothetical protein